MKLNLKRMKVIVGIVCRFTFEFEHLSEIFPFLLPNHNGTNFLRLLINKIN